MPQRGGNKVRGRFCPFAARGRGMQGGGKVLFFSADIFGTSFVVSRTRILENMK